MKRKTAIILLVIGIIITAWFAYSWVNISQTTEQELSQMIISELEKKRITQYDEEGILKNAKETLATAKKVFPIGTIIGFLIALAGIYFLFINPSATKTIKARVTKGNDE